VDKVWNCVDVETGLERDVLGVQTCIERNIEREADARDASLAAGR
jgi:hypothetical protein